MIRQIEREHPNLPQAHDEQNDLSSNIPYGVAPETYGLLLFARDHKEILEKVDSLDKRKIGIINPTRNLLYVYYFNDVSIRELKKHLGGNRTTNGKRILEALEVIWQNLPPEMQAQYPKEKAVKLKEDPFNSPRVREYHSKTAITLWQDPRYREKTLAGIRGGRSDPDYIQRMREITQRNPPHYWQGKQHKQETVDKVKRSKQEYWNKRHGIDLNDPLAKRTALVAEWQRLSQLLEHSPSSTEIERLKREGKTNFSVTMYRKGFGEGSFTRAKETLQELERRRRIMTLAGPSFEAAQKLTDYLTSKSKELAKYGILEEDIRRRNAQIKEARNKIHSATSEEEIYQEVEHLDLLLNRIERMITTRTPLSVNKA